MPTTVMPSAARHQDLDIPTRGDTLAEEAAVGDRNDERWIAETLV